MLIFFLSSIRLGKIVQKGSKISLETTTACTWTQESLRVPFNKLNKADKM